MKSLKMLGLAVVVAAALMAVIGAGSASATVICKNSSSPCTSSYASGTKYTGALKSGTEATLAAGFSTIKCTASTVGLEQTSAGGGAGVAVNGSITSLAFSGCNATVNVTALGSGNVAWTSGSSGSLTGSGTNVEIVGGTTHCFYGGSITSGLTVAGGSPATASAVNVSLERQAGSGALCANPSKWNAAYEFNGENSTAFVSNS
jgi:hypothetical protein